jgi:decaprenylphospho-beta-D-erythro-pentofuranosid-2-ulose 2-reductase
MNRPHVIIFGATSAIAQSVARERLTPDCAFTLVGRDQNRIGIVADDLRARGARAVRSFTADLGSADEIRRLLPAVWPVGETIEFVLLAQGVLPDEAKCSQDVAYGFNQFCVNANGVMILAQAAADRLVKGEGGVVVVIGSVAGDRGRQSNYHYGSAKAAVATFTEGLRHRFFGSSVTVLLVKPGFVDTPMTAAIPKNPLFATPASVAKAILHAIRKRQHVIYVPTYWRFIMLIIESIPARIFYRTRL